MCESNEIPTQPLTENEKKGNTSQFNYETNVTLIPKTIQKHYPKKKIKSPTDSCC